jgi:hypothetical protein
VLRMQQTDSTNLAKVDSIIKKHGWLSVKEIGLKANTAQFIVLQHADLETQEKYLPMLQKAMAERKILPSSYAMFVDRIEFKNHRTQKYGTQVLLFKNGRSELMPLQNPDSVLAWRQAIGIKEPFANYLKRFNLEWDLKKYKKREKRVKKKYSIVN